MLIFGVMVVLLRNPVSSALSLVVCFLALAALFIQLEAFFVGVVQILVYAGAVMVLFLFIIMLLDLKTEALSGYRLPAFAAGAAILTVFAVTLFVVLMQFPEGDRPMPEVGVSIAQEVDRVEVAETEVVVGEEVTPVVDDDVRSLGKLLFSQYVLPFQLIGVLIFVATIGVVILSKRELT